jgi:hypothetical protein
MSRQRLLPSSKGNFTKTKTKKKIHIFWTLNRFDWRIITEASKNSILSQFNAIRAVKPSFNKINFYHHPSTSSE